MGEARNTGSKVTVRRVEQASGPRGVRIEFKQRTDEKDYLRALLKSKEYQLTEGESVKNTPFLCLYVVKGNGQTHRDEVLAVLRQDPEIDLSGVDMPEGTPG